MQEPKFFQIDATNHSPSEEPPPFEGPEEDDEDNQLDNDLLAMLEELVILLHALAGISSPQTLKIRGFIKHRPIVFLIDSGSIHNFIHQRVVEVVILLSEQSLISRSRLLMGGTMKCEDCCENVKLQMWGLSPKDPHVCHQHEWV